MTQHKRYALLKKKPVPAIFTLFFLLAFIGVYWVLTQRMIAPYYLSGLLFSIPFLVFAILTVLTAQGRLSSLVTPLSIILSIGFGFSMMFSLLFISIHASTSQITDISRYDRVLQFSHYPDRLLETCFPASIPENAENIAFSYTPAFMQGGRRTVLEFRADADTISDYAEKFSKNAKWVGAANSEEAEQYGVFTGTFHVLDYEKTGLPDGCLLYVMFSKPDPPGDWNHGAHSVAAINAQRSEVIFLADDW